MTEFDVRVTLDTKAQTAHMTIGGKKLSLKLTRPIKAVTHVGYGTIHTTTAFSEVQIGAK